MYVLQLLDLHLTLNSSVAAMSGQGNILRLEGDVYLSGQ